MCLVKCFLALSVFNHDGRDLFSTWGECQQKVLFFDKLGVIYREYILIGSVSICSRFWT